jgi:hypothetical protein
MPLVVKDNPNSEKMQEEEQAKKSHEERRSECLKGVIHLTMEERNEAMVKKEISKVTTKSLISLSILKIMCYTI